MSCVEKARTNEKKTFLIHFISLFVGKDAKDKPVFLKDIWPSPQEVQEIERCLVIPSVFKLVSNRISYGNKEWSNLNVPNSSENNLLYQWNPLSTFIQPPNYLQEMMTGTMTDYDPFLYLLINHGCNKCNKNTNIIKFHVLFLRMRHVSLYYDKNRDTA